MKYTGKGITIRINDDGVDSGNKDFNGKFREADSCSAFAPLNQDDHGTMVAGIISAKANNEHCAAGIAYESSFSSCNFFSDGIAYSDLAYKLETFDISQNSIGMP